MSDFSTFGIGGPARFFAQAHTPDQMEEMLQAAHRLGLRVFILGKGSNTLFDDRGFNGLVIQNRIDYIQTKEEGIFRAGSGYSFARLGGMTAKLGWSGLEFAAGIPATVGGAIYMNAGANGKETADTLIEATFLTLQGERLCLKRDQLEFAYRTSCFQKRIGAIVEGVFQLNAEPTAKKLQKELVSYRLNTQPYGEKSAGCAFRNPPGMAAGQLIEQCGLKGSRIGGAKVSCQHGNFIVNAGLAQAKDVIELMARVKDQVFAHKGIALEEEIRVIPYDL